jgi:hypothetical protein
MANTCGQRLNVKRCYLLLTRKDHEDQKSLEGENLMKHHHHRVSIKDMELLTGAQDVMSLGIMLKDAKV